jgi:hypothetical protein
MARPLRYNYVGLIQLLRKNKVKVFCHPWTINQRKNMGLLFLNFDNNGNFFFLFRWFPEEWLF